MIKSSIVVKADYVLDEGLELHLEANGPEDVLGLALLLVAPQRFQAGSHVALSEVLPELDIAMAVPKLLERLVKEE
ncbi:hypothetical protein L861_01705 [Litchfieldella anticariensis FP35 = DSM 16096]|uniref:Uncharacterized protein n=1 Tax=Litchfieldella anticariensis (strain DSM 16096 / CECT 5854 / CIP 108499 / LMG 22089 / FP35) TaxID=1121939 RepID=S2LHA7_LITA3|nr:hypothetical protein [Halomonas anticariensis]EPC04046.1 hypothetical protein L861_01705 [Halomonas anticariensis FP35 = DSM 16096]